MLVWRVVRGSDVTDSESQDTDGGQQISSALWEAISEDSKRSLATTSPSQSTNMRVILTFVPFTNRAVEEQEARHEDLTVFRTMPVR